MQSPTQMYKSHEKAYCSTGNAWILRMTFLHKQERLLPVNEQTCGPMYSHPWTLQHSLYDVLPYHTNTSSQDPPVSPRVFSA